MIRLLSTKYKEGARGPDEFDCWGLVRAARIELFGYPALPLLSDVAPRDFKSIASAHATTRDMLGFTELANPVPGCIVMAWRGSLCVHVGIAVRVDGRMLILETDADTGPVLTDPMQFKRRYSRVVFYENQDLQRPALDGTD